MGKDIKWLRREVAALNTDIVTAMKSAIEVTNINLITRLNGGLTTTRQITELIEEVDVSVDVTKPEVPRYVADRITSLGYMTPEDTIKVMTRDAWFSDSVGEGDEVDEWVINNIATLSDALRYGFIVATEQLYLVLNKEMCTMLVRKMDGQTITVSDALRVDELYPAEITSHSLTESEIKSYDPRYFSFAVPVENVKLSKSDKAGR